MKKIYLTILTICVAGSLAKAQSVPTCSLDAAFVASGKVGVWPDSATNFISGTVGLPYEQNITVRVPQDTSAGGFTFCFNRFELSTPSSVTNYNLPPGLNFGSSTAAVNNGTVNSAPAFKFPGNATNCASIYGTPTVAGTYSLEMTVVAFATSPFPATTCPASPNVSGGTGIQTQTLKYYYIVINPPVGVQELGEDKVALYQNVPNPFSSTTDIKFYVEDEEDATVTIYNALGAVVSQQTVKTVLGENKVTINASDFANGTYIYSLKYKNAITTKRMMVINNQ
jgi:hypothetical protein